MKYLKWTGRIIVATPFVIIAAPVFLLFFTVMLGLNLIHWAFTGEWGI